MVRAVTVTGATSPLNPEPMAAIEVTPASLPLERGTSAWVSPSGIVTTGGWDATVRRVAGQRDLLAADPGKLTP